MDRDDRIENKIDKIVDDVTDIKITLGKQHVVLVEHESRSTKLETIVLPIHRKVLWIEGMLKLVGALGFLLGVAEAIKYLLEK